MKDFGRTIQTPGRVRPGTWHPALVLVALMSLVTVQACPATAGSVFVPQSLVEHATEDLVTLKATSSNETNTRCESCQASLLVHRVVAAAQVFDLLAPPPGSTEHVVNRSTGSHPGPMNEAGSSQWLVVPKPHPPQPSPHHPFTY